MRYVVIFKAQTNQLDDRYTQMAQHLRNKATTHYHCQKFETLNQHQTEIALSYWNSLTDIQAWQNDAEHQVAQTLGKSVWYTHFSVEICEVLKRYNN